MLNICHTCHSLAARTVTAGLLALAALAPGCGGKPPLAPTPPPPFTPPVVLPPSFAPPVVTGLSESLGSTGGGAELKIEGTGFLALEGGPVVIFGGIRAGRVSVRDSTAIFTTVPPHEAGLVDIVVSNPDGQSARLVNAYTYASPDSFDPNGEWEGGAQTGHVLFRFTIQNSRLIAISCDSSGTVSFSPAPPVSNGEFAFSREDGVAIAGRLVSPRDAIGTINLAPCTNSDWFARKQL